MFTISIPGRKENFRVATYRYLQVLEIIALKYNFLLKKAALFRSNMLVDLHK